MLTILLTFIFMNLHTSTAQAQGPVVIQHACTAEETLSLADVVQKQFAGSIVQVRTFTDSGLGAFKTLYFERKKVTAGAGQSFGEFLHWRWFYRKGLIHAAKDGLAAAIDHNIKDQNFAVALAEQECLNQIRIQYPSMAYTQAERDALQSLTQGNHTEIPNFRAVVAEGIVLKSRYILSHPQGAGAADFAADLQLITGTGLPDSWLHAVQATNMARLQPDAPHLNNAIAYWEMFLKQLASTDLKSFRSLHPSKDLATVTLGQLYYEKKDYLKALAVLSKVPPESTAYTDALKTKAWAYLMAQNYAKAGGVAFTFQLNNMARAYAPDAILVSGISFFENCRFKESIRSVKLFFTKYKLLHDWLGNWTKTQEDPYSLAIGFLRKTPGIPPEVGMRLISSPSFMASQAELNLIFDEEAAMKPLLNHSVLKPVALDFINKRPALETATMDAMKKTLGERLASLSKDLEENSDMAQLIEVDAQNAQGEKIIQNYAGGKKPVQATRAPAAVKTGMSWASFNSQTMKQQEIWKDELDFLSADITNDCKK